MARYINADVLIEKMVLSEYIFAETPFQKGVNSAIDYWITEINHFPSADVVPKSEVEALKDNNMFLQYRRFKELSEVRQEVAREIIKDLVDFVDKKERQKLIFGKSVWYVESDDLTDFIAELKKKYTKGELID